MRPPPQPEAFDFVVAGAGSAGCVLAARLAEDPKVSVLLLEAGGDGKSLFVTMPAGNGFLFGHPAHDWGFQSTAQAGLGGRRLYYPRGRGLGGSANLNGMIYIRGNRADYDRWHQYGLDGWSYADVLPYFRRQESAPHRDAGYHGQSGRMRITPAANHRRIDEIFIEAACQAGAPRNPDFNGATQLGAGRFDSTVFQGKRQSTARAYLGAPPPNLTIRTGVRVRRLLIEGRRAIGVGCNRGGGLCEIRARREVISCPGAFGSPQLLMLSGLGPAAHLREMGLEVAADLPGVGANLQDHPNMALQYECLQPALSLAKYQRLDRALLLGLRYLARGDGPGAAPFWGAALFHSFRDPDLPDLQVFFTPMIVTESPNRADWRRFLDASHLGRSALARGKNAATGYQLDINLLRPRSRGRLRLASPDPTAAPLIDPAYFRDQRDLRDLVAGVRHLRKVADQPALRAITGAEFSPGRDIETDEAIAEAIRCHATTGHHPVSTCRMGRGDDPNAVLDAALRVRGIDGLRVVDAAAFPDQISGNPNATIIMMAEKAADLILDRPALAADEPAREMA